MCQGKEGNKEGFSALLAGHDAPMWMQVHDRDRRVVAGELVLRPAALLGAALSCLRNTGLYMAARLGTTCKEVMNDHSMWNMALVQSPPPCLYLTAPHRWFLMLKAGTTQYVMLEVLRGSASIVAA